jgi:hypothetical protein
MKSPTEVKLNYKSQDIATTSATTYTVNTVRDLARVNRHDMMSTKADGHPLVYRCAVTMSPAAKAVGSHCDQYFADADSSAVGFLTDLEYRLKILGVGKNWVYREGSKKVVKARESMYRKAGVKKSDRGAYDKHIRYCYSAGDETYLNPLNAAGAAFTGGSWELSELVFPEDATGAFIKLQGNHSTEETNVSFTTLSLPQLYLSSRNQVRADSNNDVTDQPADSSVLKKLLGPDYMGGTIQAEIIDLARDNQDNPPYDLDQLGDATEARELGRIHIGQRSGTQATCIVDIPFGISQFEIQAFNRTDTDDAQAVTPVQISVEVLQIYEM